MRTIILLVCISLGLAACNLGAGSLATPTLESRPSSPPAEPVGSGIPGGFQPAACRFALPEDVVEGVDVECGTLTVMENRTQNDDGNERLIRLAVAVFHPPGGASQPDPVIYLSGGPGASVLEMLRYQYEALSKPAFASGRDLVLFDQRGVGVSRPALDCPGFNQLAIEFMDREMEGGQLSEAEMAAKLLESLQVCRDDLAKVADLSAYNSVESAADVHELKQALGYEQANLWGGSYGTRLALEVMRIYPEGWRSVVLDAVYPPDVDLYAEAPANYHRSLERFFESCSQNDVCNQAYPELRKVFYGTVERMNATPVESKITNLFTGEEYIALLDGNGIMGLTFQLLYDSKIRFVLPKYIYAASQGDTTAFDLVRGSILGLVDVSSRGMTFSVQCREEFPYSSADLYHQNMERYPELATMYENNLLLGGLFYKACEIWDVGVADQSANQPVVSDIPTLILTGEFDPITPPEWGRKAADTLEQAKFYEFPGIGHGASVVDECPRNMMIGFLNDPEVEPDDRCITSMVKP